MNFLGYFLNSIKTELKDWYIKRSEKVHEYIFFEFFPIFFINVILIVILGCLILPFELIVLFKILSITLSISLWMILYIGPFIFFYYNKYQYEKARENARVMRELKG